MSIKFSISNEDRIRIKNLYLNEKSKEEDRKFCHKNNVKSLEEIVGEDEQEDYIEGIKIRKSGINSLTDMIETLKTMRTRPPLIWLMALQKLQTTCRTKSLRRH
jgi:hypothetical protein